MNFRAVRFVSAAVLIMTISAACSGPDAGPVRTVTTDDPVATPAANPTETPVDSGTAPTATSEPSGVSDVSAEPTATAVEHPEPTAFPTEVMPEPTSIPEPSPTPTVAPTPTQHVALDGAILPDHRIVAYYGHPSTGLMGILGEYEKEELLEVLRAEIANYEAADPDTPVIPAFELIATVAQPEPQSDGTYLLYTGDPWIQEYVDFTAENDMLLFLDLQVGHSTIRDQLGLVWHWLQYPHVHVAIDPEFATGPDHPPGTIIGGVDGGHINIAIEALSELVLETGLPPKILVVHQFDTRMIRNKHVIQPLPGVDFVLHMDGWGTTEAKVGNYHHFVRNELIQYGGFKIFYRQDIPVMEAEEVLRMEPPPLFISYQ